VGLYSRSAQVLRHSSLLLGSVSARESWRGTGESGGAGTATRGKFSVNLYKAPDNSPLGIFSTLVTGMGAVGREHLKNNGARGDDEEKPKRTNQKGEIKRESKATTKNDSEWDSLQ
jgi:hypothetical protein